MFGLIEQESKLKLICNLTMSLRYLAHFFGKELYWDHQLLTCVDVSGVKRVRPLCACPPTMNYMASQLFFLMKNTDQYTPPSPKKLNNRSKQIMEAMTCPKHHYKLNQFRRPIPENQHSQRLKASKTSTWSN